MDQGGGEVLDTCPTRMEDDGGGGSSMEHSNGNSLFIPYDVVGLIEHCSRWLCGLGISHTQWLQNKQ